MRLVVGEKQWSGLRVISTQGHPPIISITLGVDATNTSLNLSLWSSGWPLPSAWGPNGDPRPLA